MALIKCPECGKENVSDSAVSCPECGFAIKKYYVEKLWKEQNEKEQARIKKSIKAKMTKYLVLFIVCLLSALPLMYFAAKVFIKETFMGVILIAIDCILFIAAIAFYAFRKNAKEEWNAINNDWESYQDLMDSRQKAAQQFQESEARRKAEIEQHLQEEKERREAVATLTCPLCGSKNKKRISTLNRGASVYMVGLASSKIGKQYECKNCKHKW